METPGITSPLGITGNTESASVPTTTLRKRGAASRKKEVTADEIITKTASTPDAAVIVTKDKADTEESETESENEGDKEEEESDNEEEEGDKEEEECDEEEEECDDDEEECDDDEEEGDEEDFEEELTSSSSAVNLRVQLRGRTRLAVSSDDSYIALSTDCMADMLRGAVLGVCAALAWSLTIAVTHS